MWSYPVSSYPFPGLQTKRHHLGPIRGSSHCLLGTCSFTRSSFTLNHESAIHPIPAGVRLCLRMLRSTYPVLSGWIYTKFFNHLGGIFSHQIFSICLKFLCDTSNFIFSHSIFFIFIENNENSTVTQHDFKPIWEILPKTHFHNPAWRNIISTFLLRSFIIFLFLTLRIST